MNELFDQIVAGLSGFRLQYLEVLNWGTFNRMVWHIHPDGQNALLTGDIGSGKSTLVDAITCLLVPHHKIIFNKAAGAEGKERNLLSYIRGEYKKEKEEITRAAKKVYLRPDDNFYTVIIGNFFNEGYNENVCLAQMFWVGKEGKVEKLLAIGTVPLSVQEHFSNFGDINELRKRLRSSQYIHLFNDNFSQYSEQFRRLFGMNSDKAIDLFYQTVSMKSVSSLTDFVREQMLEKTDVREQIAALLKRFEDLKKAHEAVVHAREQYYILKPLVGSCRDYDEVVRQIDDLESMLTVLPVWFAERKWALLQTAIEDAKKDLDRLSLQQQRWRDELNVLEETMQAIQLDIASHGGARIEQIAAEIRREEHDKQSKKREFDDYDKLVSRLGLRTIDNEEGFETNVAAAKQMSDKCAVLEKEYREQRDQLISDLRSVETDYQAERRELESLQERQTQIPAWLIGFRNQLCADLRISEEALPFAGELLQVHESESRWEGAIEKLLRDLGISLLVPQSHYRSVGKYVNENRLQSVDGRGIKLTYLQTELKVAEPPRNLDAQSVAYKVDVKPDSPYHDWLEAHLQRSFGDFLCTDVQGLEHMRAGITPEGLVKSGRIRHTKDDRKRIDDRRNYVLGWSNAQKIKVLLESVHKLAQKADELREAVVAVEEREKKNQETKQLLSHLLFMTDYSRIDWQFHVHKIYDLEKEQNELLTNNDILQQLQNNRTEVADKIREAKSTESDLAEKIGGSKTMIQNYKEQLQSAASYKEQSEPELKRKWYPVIDAKPEAAGLTLRNLENRQEAFRKQYQGDSGELKRLRGRQMGFRSAIERRMREIKDHSKAEYNEIAESVDARAEYISKYNQLVTEDLKRHEDRFKEELNKNVINSISVFDNQLQKHEQDIRQKILMINQHLSEIEYDTHQNTYITILIDPAANKDIRLFREDLKNCYVHSFSAEEHLYTEDKYEKVKRILDRFASMEYADKEWTSTVTDVRQWFEFNATERFRSDNTEKEFYEGSGGKSGGQKEKLAYTILASALAYQFGLQFGEARSKSFRFVVIDEAFGRGSDESTRYGLELFKKLNLQLLIVTPLQKIHVIENHVNSFHFISNREGNNSQISNFTKSEYEERKRMHHEIMQNVRVI